MKLRIIILNKERPSLGRMADWSHSLSIGEKGKKKKKRGWGGKQLIHDPVRGAASVVLATDYPRGKNVKGKGRKGEKSD